jgi:hypothetical protein
MFARWPLFAETEDGRLVAGFVSQEADQYPDGLAIFDLRTGEVERTLPGFDISRTMVATGDDALFAMTRGGDLVRVDLASGASQVVEHHPANPEEIALVR